MKKLNGREMKTLFILSIVVPVSLLTTFKLTGILQKSPTLQTIAVEPVNWQIDRPRETIEFRDMQRIKNFYTNDEVSVDVGVHINAYHENSLGVPYYGNDGIELTVDVNASFPSNADVAFTVRLYPMDNESAVLVRTDFMIEQNVTVTHIRQWGRVNQESCVVAQSEQSSLYLSVMAHWLFHDQNCNDHQLKVVLELAYQNQSLYKKVELPIFLEMEQDAGETFETAKNITFGEYRRCIDLVDYVDLYALSIHEGQIINIIMNPPKDANYDVYLYNPSRIIVVNSTNAGNSAEFIAYVANATGVWYLEVSNQAWPGHDMAGIYTLRVEVLS